MASFDGIKLLILIGFAGLGALAGGCGKSEEAQKPSASRVLTVAVQETEYAPEVCLTGEIKARVQTNLSFRVSGRIIARTAEVGDHVTPDQVLAKIDPTEQRADVLAAESSVASFEASVRQTSAAFERQKTLLKEGFTTKREYDLAEQAYRTAQGSLEAARAQLGTVRDTLSFTELKAGSSGLITARNAEVGQVAQAAQTVFTLAEDGGRDAVFHVYESAFLQKMQSKSIALTLVSNPKIASTGTVREVSPTADTASGTVRVKVTLDQPRPDFALGSVVMGCANFELRKAVMLPAKALTRLNDSPAVWIVDPNTRAVDIRPITIAAYRTRDIIVDGGLEPGLLVVTDGTKMLRPAQVVTIEPETSP